jgi:hypothetical protein
VLLFGAQSNSLTLPKDFYKNKREGETWMEGISIRSRIILCPLSLELYPMGFGSYFLVLLHVNTLRRKSDIGYFLGEGSWRIEKTTKEDIVEGHGGSRNDGWGHR